MHINEIHGAGGGGGGYSGGGAGPGADKDALGVGNGAGGTCVLYSHSLFHNFVSSDGTTWMFLYLLFQIGRASCRERV